MMNTIRTRRLRQSLVMRQTAIETFVQLENFIYPYFVIGGEHQLESIPSMPGIQRMSIDFILQDVGLLLKNGINKILLFGVGEAKTSKGESAAASSGLIPTAIRALKKEFGNDLLVITDVCLCAYTNHGHCGVLHDGQILNDATLPHLQAMALAHVQAGADIIAPSDMMDGRVAAIRSCLDKEGFTQTPIMSYSTKFASAYYGPFRDAADSKPGQGDRKSYQMDYRNGREAIRESLIDEQEGADILMVKPALAYLDVIKKISEHTMLPIACYNVSAEYSMVKAASANGWIDEKTLVIENMHAFKRAGASVIISYHAKDIALNKWL